MRHVNILRSNLMPLSGFDLDPNLYNRSELATILNSSTAAGRRSLVTPATMSVTVGASPLTFPSFTLDLDVSANWDSISPTNYSVAANRAGKDFYLYATPNGLIVSANSTAPNGYTSANSTKIDGFHCLCLNAGIISGHSLSGFLTGNILPKSIWDLKHKPAGICSPEGMVYSPETGLWVDIYLQSGTGVNTRSAFGATITDTRNWGDFVDDFAAVGKRLLFDAEYQAAAEGSNQQTNIAGSADPVTTGGHVDTLTRRMVSHIGLEDCCGAMWQWLQDQSYQNDATYSATFGWVSPGGSKGQLYRQSATGDVKLLAGGAWAHGSACGSRSRAAGSARWATASDFGARGCCRGI